MFTTIKFKTLGLDRMSVLGGLLFAAVLALLPIPAQSQCAKWNASGDVTIIQRRARAPIYLTLAHNGRVIGGTAVYYALTGNDGFERQQVKGTVDGTLEGNSFNIQIFWPDGLTGVYSGKVLPSGMLDGETYDKNNTKIRQPWHSEELLKCALSGPSKGFKITSKITLPPSAPSPSVKNTPASKPAPPPPPMKVPGIIASQVVFPAPYVPAGFVVLQWDGGPDHPYAEVWVKVDGGDETKVVEQGKGGLQVTVVRGRIYEYILTDDGKTLATVTFIVPRR